MQLRDARYVMLSIRRSDAADKFVLQAEKLGRSLSRKPREIHTLGLLVANWIGKPLRGRHFERSL